MAVARAITALVLLVAAALSALGAWNWARLGGSGLADEMRRVVERSERIREGAHPGYQEQVLAGLPPNPLTGPVLRLDDHLADAKVVSEDTRHDLGGSGVVFGFEMNDAAPFAARQGLTQVSVAEGVLVIDHDPDDDLASSAPVDVPMDEVGEVLIRARHARGKHLRIAWSTEVEPEDPWFNRLEIPVMASGEYHTYVINAKNAMKRGLREGDHIRRLYLQVSDVAGDRVEIDTILFLSKQSFYLQAPRGVAYERIGAELRPVLYMLPTQELAWTLRVPDREPRFDVGLGVLFGGKPMTFRVRVEADGAETELLEETLEDARAWRDERLDLTPWAGREVRLALRAEGHQGNVAFWNSPVVSPTPEQPFRVIVILEDTMRADHLSVYGYERATTPGKQALMNEDGVVFLRMASQSTKTRSSVPSLMTSLLPSATGVWNFADMLSDRYLTLAEVLRQQDFVTASFTQNTNAGPVAGVHQGFDRLLDAELIGTTPGALFGETLDAWIDRHHDRNFFLYLHVMDPHGVYEPPPPFDAWYRELPDDAPAVEPDPHLDAAGVERPTQAGRRALYDGEILHNDGFIAGFVAGLRERGLYEDTLLVLTSDHGEYLGEHGRWEHEPPGLLQVTRVPLMFVYPRRFEGGARIEANVQTIDVMPTALELASVSTDSLLLQGDSLVGLVEGRDPERWSERVTLSEEPDLMDKTRAWRNRGVRVTGSFFQREHHFITSRRFWPESGIWPELLRMKVFDVAADPAELSPLRAFWLDAHLHYRFASLLNAVQANGIAAWEAWTAEESRNDHRLDPDSLDQLRELGYIE